MTNVHVFYGGNDLRVIPHLRLGHGWQSHEIGAYDFFLGITHVRRTISYLAREERVSCVDRMLLPAIRQVCPPHVIQHHPQSFDDVESKTYSGLQESYSGMVRSGRDALHHIPLEYLEEIWVEIARHVEHADLVQFRGMFTVLVA